MGDRSGNLFWVRTSEDKIHIKDLCGSVRAVYVREKLPDVSVPDLIEAGCYTCGFLDGYLIEQTRGKHPRILAFANTRTALRARREDPGDITRILLIAVADSLAQ